VERIDADALLNKLFTISGRESRALNADDYLLVSESLHHSRDDIRERAIFIGGLRWMDATILGSFVAALVLNTESSDDNKRLMIEALASRAIERQYKVKELQEFLNYLLASSPAESLCAKAAFVAKERLDGRMTKAQFAVLNYDQVTLEKGRSLDGILVASKAR
jgi:hypothetical protein